MLLLEVSYSIISGVNFGGLTFEANCFYDCEENIALLKTEYRGP